MKTIRITLVTDGPSDRSLIHPLRWLCAEVGIRHPVELVWAELRYLPRPPISLEERVRKSLDLFPCDLLFIHRNAEREDPGDRMDEIGRAVRGARLDLFQSPAPHVCVVPVRMTEAWLMFDEIAIRRAAGNPTGSTPLSLPPIRTVDTLPDPKTVLHGALAVATGKPPRRLKSFNPHQAVHRVAELIDDFSPLLAVEAFGKVAEDLRRVVREAQWG